MEAEGNANFRSSQNNIDDAFSAANASDAMDAKQ